MRTGRTHDHGGTKDEEREEEEMQEVPLAELLDAARLGISQKSDRCSICHTKRLQNDYNTD